MSVGIALYPEDGTDFDTLLQKTDTAMYRAKAAGRNTYRFFDQEMNKDSFERLKVRNGLRQAIERNEFVLYYQPQIDLNTNRIFGAEALVRWQSPEMGLMAPGRFISVAEESGLIVPIGAWVIKEACRQVAAWRKTGLPELTVAVNLSALQFLQGDLEKTVKEALDASGLEPRCLELELTESILIQDTEAILATVKRLAALGVQLSIDDFGTGYSSMSYLKRFSVDKLKIDQSFVRDLATDPDDAAIVRAIIQMAQGMGLKTIAEGVETEEILQLLRGLHCDEAQGYYFARPMAAADFVVHMSHQQVPANTPADSN
jgi:EAL domain-containing protein (putative c-di-GMP-specific phosphodiesterase class I)